MAMVYSATLHTLPIELIYRILDHLDVPTILLSFYGVCTRFNQMINTYNRFKTCTEIKLSYEKITNETLKYLLYPLKTSMTITKLNLDENKIGAQGAKYLANALQNDMVLEDLTLTNNNIGNQGAEYIADALKINTTLKKLNLAKNKIGHTGAQCLANALETLEDLCVNANDMGSQGAEYFANVLKTNKTLIEFHLGWANIGYEGAQHFVDTLKINTTLRELDLGGNDIGDIGAHVLVSVLLRRFNTTLEILAIDNNRISTGKKRLIHNLLKNTSIRVYAHDQDDFHSSSAVSPFMQTQSSGIEFDSVDECWL
ncbi:unnamed protein product [Adineta ricciae]|uniref:F-box domain-containing protein n=1 Tax=Adineta ricciae TaxID=249248 RepID=A0A814U2F8_ADIRI|nr:unnamed protein product [Adineta ricciae]